MSLWDKVQKCHSRKISQYWEWQEWDLFAELLRTESWKRMSKYLAKREYPNYKNTIDKINISEQSILKAYVIFLNSILCDYRESFRTIFKEEFDRVFGKLDYIKLPNKFKSSEIQDWDTLFSFNPKDTIDKAITDNFITKIKASPLFDKFNNDKHSKTKHVEKLLKQKLELENDMKNYRRLAIKMNYSKEEIEETSKDMWKDIKHLENEINEFLDDTDMEKYLDRLPQVLLKTVELASNAINKAQIEDMKVDMIKLIEITTSRTNHNKQKRA